MARDLGMTVAEMGERMEYCEYMQWEALYIVEGEETKRAMKNVNRQ